MSNTKEVYSNINQGCMSLCQPVMWSMAAMLRDSTVVVIAAAVRTRPRAIPLAMITMRKSTHGFPFVSHMWVAYGVSLGGPSGRQSSALTVHCCSKSISLESKVVYFRAMLNRAFYLLLCFLVEITCGCKRQSKF